MINILTEPPATALINGTDYPIKSDYRIWVNISMLLEDLDFISGTKESDKYNIMIISEIIYLAFGELLNEPYIDTFMAVLEFMQGYPEMKDKGFSGHGNNKKLYSFRCDLNYIILAIRNQTGIDLTYRRKEPFHWWDFLLEFKTLEDNHYICKIMSYRAYEGKDKELLKLKQTYALPKNLTKSEQAIINELDELFYNS